MKKTFITLFTMLSIIWSIGATAQTLVFHLADGTTADVELFSAFRMFTVSGKMVVSLPGGNTKEFSQSDILTVTYRETKGDVNRDNAVDVADISAIISIMTGMEETMQTISVTTGSATEITQNSASISGVVSGWNSQFTVGIQYNTRNLLDSDSPNVTTTALGDFTITLTGLIPNATYYYRAFAEIDSKYYYGETKIFKTGQDEALLLSGMLAADSETRLFSEALQLTGLADTLRNYIYNDYEYPGNKYYYRSHTWSEVAWYNKERWKKFTVFAETDDVLAAQGITSISQLKAYAKLVYDEAFPEDANVSDMTDRRNSLNRFVAYHILPFGSSYWYLTYYDGKMTDKYVDTNMTDINTWYGTLMPSGSLKCSYPMGSDSGIFLNRRGLKDGPDKYGKQVRGAKVVASTDGDDPFTHEAFNGYYYHIDRMLVYDKQTREDVLGSELWRVDFKALSPDIMNNAEELRGNYLMDDANNTPDDSPNPKNGRNYIYKWDCIENIFSSSEKRYPDLEYNNYGIVARRAHCNFWSWQGDEINVFGPFDFTIKLPPLPAGEWEVRMGHCALETRPDVRIYLNGQVTIDSLKLCRFYYSPDKPFREQGLQSAILDYMSQNVFVVTPQDNGTFLVTDVKTGEQMVMKKNPYPDDYYSISYSILGAETISRFFGTDPSTGDNINWNVRANEYREQTTKDYITTLPKIMHFPRELLHFSPSGYQWRYTDEQNERTVRYPLGRIKTDGKSDNYLRIEYLWNGLYGNNDEFQLDFLEFVPKFIYDNISIPEE